MDTTNIKIINIVAGHGYNKYKDYLQDRDMIINMIAGHGFGIYIDYQHSSRTWIQIYLGFYLLS